MIETSQSTPPVRRPGRQALRIGVERLTPIAFFTSILLCAPLQAHDVWLEPSDYNPPSGARVAVRVLVGEGFVGEAVPRNESRLERFAAIGPAGESPLPGVNGVDPAGFLLPESAGLYELLYVSEPRPLRVSAAKFETYLREEGLDAVRSERAERGETDRPVIELYSRCAKSLVRVGSGGTPLGSAARGCQLELLPLDGFEPEPESSWVSGEATSWRVTLLVLRNGLPLAGSLVRALPSGAPERTLERRSGADGRVSFDLDSGGPWLVKTVHMERTSEGQQADWESWWASVTFVAR